MDARRRAPPDCAASLSTLGSVLARRRLPPVLTSSATSLAATSRRNRGLRTLPDLGSGILVSTCGGSSKSRALSRKNWRSCASTVGFPSRDETTTATPRRRARGTHTTSPGRSRATLSRTSSAAPLVAVSADPRPGAVCAFSRYPQYSSKSPRSHTMFVRYPSSVARSCWRVRSRATTPRSARN